MKVSKKDINIQNLYSLDGRVPKGKAFLVGAQHVMAMFVANIAPIMLICTGAVYNGVPFTDIDLARMMQAALLIAGLGTLIQLYPVWRVGAKLPIVMGVSFTFAGALIPLAAEDYGYVVGAVLIGGIIEGLLGLTVKYWGRFIAPVVPACVVIAVGISLFETGISNAVESASYEAGSWQNLLVAGITLVSCLIFRSRFKGFWKQLYILFGLLTGYIVAILMGMVDFHSISDMVGQMGIISLPRLFAFTPKFRLGAIINVTLVFLVSAIETMGDSSSVCTSGLNREITKDELRGALACDGFVSAISGGIFGCTPITSFSQNVGLITLTGIVNRYSLLFGALILIAAGFFPPIGAILATLPNCVLGGCAIVMFGVIVIAGIRMLVQCGLNERNSLITAISLCIGIGITRVLDFFKDMPELVREIFANNCVAGVFVVAMLLSIILPKKMNEKTKE
ncbi:MAG: purine/pyrimidine permease [Lachnospiraceae bacterium]|nr:purine/pyrimidine permease [Candidatus Minthocola equi]